MYKKKLQQCQRGAFALPYFKQLCTFIGFFFFFFACLVRFFFPLLESYNAPQQATVFIRRSIKSSPQRAQERTQIMTNTQYVQTHANMKMFHLIQVMETVYSGWIFWFWPPKIRKPGFRSYFCTCDAAKKSDLKNIIMQKLEKSCREGTGGVLRRSKRKGREIHPCRLLFVTECARSCM